MFKLLQRVLKGSRGSEIAFCVPLRQVKASRGLASVFTMQGLVKLVEVPQVQVLY